MNLDAGLEVVRPGLLTTVQDLGRWGSQHLGVPVSGAMDTFSHRLANALVGNPAGDATLEVTLVGPELRAVRPLVAALAGAAFVVSVDGQVTRHHTPFDVPAGSTVRFGERRGGARAYLALAGGIATPPVLGSRSTHLLSGLGGRALAAGDRLPVGAPRREAPRGRARDIARPENGGPVRLRVMVGPQDAWFSRPSLDALLHDAFRISVKSNRMAFRLEGPALAVTRAEEPLSEPVPFGAIQVPADGAPILLMADRQTAGGYPKIATVIAADLPLAGQLAPGDVVRFVACTRGEARAALIARERELLRALPVEAQP